MSSPLVIMGLLALASTIVGGAFLIIRQMARDAALADAKAASLRRQHDELLTADHARDEARAAAARAPHADSLPDDGFRRD